MHRSLARGWSICVLLLLLNACATVEKPDISLDDREKLAQWERYKAELSTISSWRLRGKMGVKTGSKGGSATLKWRYSSEQQRIELYGPFGGGRVIITVDENGAVLKDTKGKVIRGETASEVLYRRLGWQVPFDHLTDWARGLPSEGASDIVINNEGRLKRLVQDNWQVKIQNYQPVNGSIKGLMLPTKLNVSALPGTMEIYSDQGEYLGDELNVKVILKRWWEIELEQN
jgi:outer membrane lipoprotein LolB